MNEPISDADLHRLRRCADSVMPGNQGRLVIAALDRIAELESQLALADDRAMALLEMAKLHPPQKWLAMEAVVSAAQEWAEVDKLWGQGASVIPATKLDGLRYALDTLDALEETP
jgi:hypothetical protein